MLPQYIERPYKIELRNDCLLRKTQSSEQILHMINKLPNEPLREHSIHIFIYANVCLSRLKECSDASRAVLIEIGREHNKIIKSKEQCNANMDIKCTSVSAITSICITCWKRKNKDNKHMYLESDLLPASRSPYLRSLI